MKLRLLFIPLLTVLLSAAAFAQTNTKNDNLLFLLRQPEHISQAIKTIGSLYNKGGGTLHPGKTEIIVCGETVKQLTTDEGSVWVEQLKNFKDVKLVACGLSLNKFNLDRKDLLPGISYTENGFIRAFELQKQGYLSVEL